MTKYRILALDGGGIRGVLTARLLERLTSTYPTLLRNVDLIAGTSTGGILALGLAAAFAPSALKQLYLDNAAEIFDDTWLDDLRDLGGLSGAQYSTDGLQKVANKVFGDKTLADLDKKVLIPTFDLDNAHPNPQQRSWKPKFFHNFPGNDSDGHMRVVDVALATTAAPTYFPSHQGFVDGGVVANNPSMAALAQALDPRSNLKVNLSDIALLSLGTGTTLYYIPGQTLDWGYAQWVKPLIDLMLEGSMGIADFQCQQILASHYQRLAPVMPTEKAIKMDEWRRANELVDIADATPLDRVTQWLQQVGW